MHYGLKIGARTFNTTGDAVKYYEDMQQRIFDRKEMLNARGRSEEDTGSDGETFEAVNGIYQNYLALTRQAMPQPVGYYARRDHEHIALGQDFREVIRMAAYFSDNTEHVFNIGHAIKTISRHETRRAA